jgi:hypothetical protein
LPFNDGDPSRVEQYAPQSPFAPPPLVSALLFGCGCVGSPDVPAVPDVACDEELDEACEVFAGAELPVDFLPWDVLLWDGFAACELVVVVRDDEAACAAPLPFPVFARAVPLAPRDIIIKSSAATTDATVVSGRARSCHARNMEKLPANPPGPREGGRIRETTGTQKCGAPQWIPSLLPCTRHPLPDKRCAR